MASSLPVVQATGLNTKVCIKCNISKTLSNYPIRKTSKEKGC